MAQRRVCAGSSVEALRLDGETEPSGAGGTDPPFPIEAVATFPVPSGPHHVDAREPGKSDVESEAICNAVFRKRGAKDMAGP